MAIEPFSVRDLTQLGPLQPSGWAPIIPFFEFYLQNSFCRPIKYASRGTIIGVGTAILHDDTAWIAHIIVNTDFRNQGIGTTITRHLIASLQADGMKTISLIASTLGEPVYKKLGFEKDVDYLFFKTEQKSHDVTKKSISFEPRFQGQLLALDARVYGEIRTQLLLPHLDRARIILEQNEITGYYLPTLGEGPIVAQTDFAGCSLLAEKHSNENTRVVLPMQNKTAIEFLHGHGFVQFLTGSRMHRGRRIPYQPTKIYNRTGGNLG